jgi:hypothetical protein
VEELSVGRSAQTTLSAISTKPVAKLDMISSIRPYDRCFHLVGTQCNNQFTSRTRSRQETWAPFFAFKHNAQDSTSYLCAKREQVNKAEILSHSELGELLLRDRGFADHFSNSEHNGECIMPFMSRPYAKKRGKREMSPGLGREGKVRV